MARERILIVEDEGIVAEDLKSLLGKLGYECVGTCATGEEAIRKAEETHPDLVLMDIRLKGDIDGIEAAESITARFDIPVTYLTAYADESTLGRAKATLPYGYILKPFEERDLRTAVEIALYKHKMESFLKRMDDWHAETLRRLAEAVVALDREGRVTFLNAAAEELLGWKMERTYGKSFAAQLAWMDEADRGRFQEDLQRVLADGQMRRADRAVAFQSASDGAVSVHYSLSPVGESAGRSTGVAVVFQRVSKATDGRLPVASA